MNSEVDFWRDTSARYMGYSNEVGEAFRPIYPRFVLPSYGLAFLYVGLDSVDKGLKGHRSGLSKKSVALKTVDALIWQTLASVLIPGKVIHGITWMAQKSVTSLKITSPVMVKWSPTLVGLSAIPFIIHPIDHAVDYFMDTTFRVWTKDQ